MREIVSHGQIKIHFLILYFMEFLGYSAMTEKF